MSRLDPPQVLIDVTALHALADPEHPQHDDVARAYDDLLAQFEREEILLVAVGTHLRDLEMREADDSLEWRLERVRWFVSRRRKGVFAPVDPMHVGFQHRRQAARIFTDPHDPEFALTLLLCQRHRVRSVLSLDERFEAYDVHLIPVAS